MNTEASLHLNVLQYGGRGISYPSWDQHFRGFSAGDDHQLYPKPHLAMRLSIAIGACTSIMAVYNAAKRMAGAMGTSWNVLKA